MRPLNLVHVSKACQRASTVGCYSLAMQPISFPLPLCSSAFWLHLQSFGPTSTQGTVSSLVANVLLHPLRCLHTNILIVSQMSRVYLPSCAGMIGCWHDAASLMLPDLRPHMCSRYASCSQMRMEQSDTNNMDEDALNWTRLLLKHLHGFEFHYADGD